MENRKRNKIKNNTFQRKNNTSAKKLLRNFAKKYGESAILLAHPHFSKKRKKKRKKAKKEKIPSAKNWWEKNVNKKVVRTFWGWPYPPSIFACCVSSEGTPESNPVWEFLKPGLSRLWGSAPRCPAGPAHREIWKDLAQYCAVLAVTYKCSFPGALLVK